MILIVRQNVTLVDVHVCYNVLTEYFLNQITKEHDRDNSEPRRLHCRGAW
jgi:hypothetical protein